MSKGGHGRKDGLRGMWVQLLEISRLTKLLQVDRLHQQGRFTSLFLETIAPRYMCPHQTMVLSEASQYDLRYYDYTERLILASLFRNIETSSTRPITFVRRMSIPDWFQKTTSRISLYRTMLLSLERSRKGLRYTSRRYHRGISMVRPSRSIPYTSMHITGRSVGNMPVTFHQSAAQESRPVTRSPLARRHEAWRHVTPQP
jgi:hypothetical protein